MKIITQKISYPLLKEKEIQLFIKRIDLIHPFISGNKSSYRPTGVDKDSFSYSQRKRAIRDKYDKTKVKKAAQKSRENHFKLQYKYG